MADCFIYDEPGVPKVHDVTVFCFGGTFRKLLLLAGNFRYTTHFIGQFPYVAKATLLEVKTSHILKNLARSKSGQAKEQESDNSERLANDKKKSNGRRS
jgi:hypothetical protein